MNRLLGCLLILLVGCGSPTVDESHLPQAAVYVTYAALLPCDHCAAIQVQLELEQSEAAEAVFHWTEKRLQTAEGDVENRIEGRYSRITTNFSEQVYHLRGSNNFEVYLALTESSDLLLTDDEGNPIRPDSPIYFLIEDAK
ncbi:MAG: copper resistance protein NlpE N-terminal domain-containing protein [Bacteroidia bacterium]